VRFLRAYIAERFPLALFGPVLAGLTAAAVWTLAEPSPAASARTLALAALLVAQFRLWDDLEDIDRDRIAHPERVLVRAPAAPFRGLVSLLIAMAAILCIERPAALAALLALEAGFWAAYRFVRPWLADEMWRYGVLLLKYPLIVLVSSLATGNVLASRLTAAAVAAYVCASAYELWHTRRAPVGARL
jgi:hypothetical protein